MAENESKDAGSLGQKRSQTASSVATGNPATTVAESNRGNTPGASRSGPTELPAQFGRYRVVKKLGGGGMGTVYLVENTELERLEALKVPHFTDGDDPQVRERFLREAKSAAKLDHSNLCPVYDAGVRDGIYYMTMRFLQGKLLSDYVGQPAPPRKSVEIVTKLALALEAAHGSGVIHRDLKPSNVMMVAGVGPVVMDFGLAKQVRKADQTLTQAGAALGTPAYMPPEQVNGELERMGPVSDVYSLGVVLYELLTGRLPFEGTMASIFGQILYVEPPMPSALVPELSPALDGICRKAMAKEPTERFPSMKDFAAALLDYRRSTPTAEGAGNLVPTAMDKAAVFQADTVAPGRRPAGSSDIYQMATVPPQARRSTPPTPRGALPPTEYRPTDGARKTNKKAHATTGDEGTSQSSIVVVLAVSLIFALTTIAIGGVLWAAGVFRVRTADGTLVVEVNEPNPDVYVDGAKVTVAWQNGGVKAEVAVKPGTRKVELKKDGFGAFGEEVTLEEHGRTLLHARLDPIKPTTETPVAPKPPVDASEPKENSAQSAQGTSAGVNQNEVETAAKGSLKTITNLIAIKLTLIPAGEFEMGSSKAEDRFASDDEQPRHHVRITRPFYLGVTEVTQGQYRAVTGQSPSFTQGPDDLAVEQVSWLDAVAFCNTLSTREKLTPYYRVNGWAVTIAGGNGYRLPTEAQWEYACRAGTTTIYSFGNDASQLGDFAWIGMNSGGRFHPVAEKPANSFGLHDVHGSVFEWCWDAFDAGYYRQSPRDDPTGPSAAPNRVSRGGGCTHGPESQRSAARSSGTPDFRNLALGFRVARDL